VSLTKAEVNERFYDAVGGDLAFETEAQHYLHPLAVARLVAAQATALGRRRIKILELGANDCTFATSLLKLLSAFTAQGEATLERIEYFAVDLARRSLEAALRRHADAGFHRAAPGSAGSPLVGSLLRLGVPGVELCLVHADARRFVAGGSGVYDVVVVNELLDDLPSRVFFADAAGSVRELVAGATTDGERWTVTVTAAEARDAPALPPSTLAVTSPEATAVVRGAAERLGSGGVMVVHDYGLVEPAAPLADYEHPPRSLPSFVELVVEPGAPRSFFRLFGDERAKVVQITTDVSFPELAAALAGAGTTIVLPHGNNLLQSRSPRGDDLREGDGVFLSELGLLRPGGDLAALLARLEREQEELRRRYAAEHLGGRASMYADLLFAKR